MPCLDCASRYIASPQALRRSLVFSNRVPTVTDVYSLQLLYWKTLRWRRWQCLW